MTFRLSITDLGPARLSLVLELTVPEVFSTNPREPMPAPPTQLPPSGAERSKPVLFVLPRAA